MIIRENTEGLAHGGVENSNAWRGYEHEGSYPKAAGVSGAGPLGSRTGANGAKVTVLHKANIMKMTDGLFLNCAADVHENDYPNAIRNRNYRRRLYAFGAGSRAI